MPEITNRNVAKKPISKSFRGILRISPAEDDADSSLTELVVPVTDSAGNTSPISMSTDQVEITKEIVNETQLKDRITIGDQADLPTASPKLNEVFVGDDSGNYKLKNIIDIIKQYLNDNNTFEQTVPVGTIIPIALAQEDLNLLPERFRDWYDFCHGQDRHSLSGREYNSTNYPELYRAIMGNPRVDYDTISLQLSQITASLFNQSNITQLTDVTINNVSGTGLKNCISVCDRLLVQDITFNTEDFFTNPTVTIKWNQAADNINITLSKEESVFLKYAYLPAGTEVTLQGYRGNKIQATGNADSIRISAYLFKGEIRKNFSIEMDNIIEETVDRKTFTIQESGIYGIFIGDSSWNDLLYNTIQNAKCIVNVPEIEAIASATLLSNNELYFPISYAEYSAYDCAHEISLNYNVSTALANNEGNIVLDNYEVFGFANGYRPFGLDSEGIFKLIADNIRTYFISRNINKNKINDSNNEYGLLSRKLNNDVDSFKLDINYDNYKEHPFGTNFFNLYLKKGTIVSAQGLSYFNNYNRSEQVYLYIFGTDASDPDSPSIYARIGGATNWTVPKDDIYEFCTPFYLIGVGFANGYNRIGAWKPYVRINQGSVQWQIERDATLLGTQYEAIGVDDGGTPDGSLKFRLPDTRNKFIRGASSIETTVPPEYEGGYVIPPHEPFSVEYPQTNLFDVTEPVSNLLEDHRHYMVAGWNTNTSFNNRNRAKMIGISRNSSEMPGYTLSVISLDPYAIDISNMYGLSGPATTRNGEKVNFPAKETRPNNITFSYLIKIK